MSALQLTDAEKSILAALPRGAAADELAARGLPSRRDERWKWTDLRASLRSAMPASEARMEEKSPYIETGEAIRLDFANGRLRTVPDQLPAGVSVSRGDTEERDFRENVANIARAAASENFVLRIEGECPRPIHLRYLSAGGGMHHTSLVVELAPGATVDVIETIETGSGGWYANNLLRYHVGDGARLTRLIAQEDAAQAVNVHTAYVMQGARSQLSQTTLGFGGRLCRVETNVLQQGAGARAVINGAYLLNEKNHLDNTTNVGIEAKGCATEELYKGVLAGQARGVFQGKFHVARAAQQTDARMAHNALLLSETAEVNAKPELEIYADNVQCAHGNTAGALDEDALFYMRQRGLSAAEARALLVEAFVTEALSAVENIALHEQLMAKVRSFMEAQR